jgi:hypothetical protein
VDRIELVIAVAREGRTGFVLKPSIMADVVPATVRLVGTRQDIPRYGSGGGHLEGSGQHPLERDRTTSA